MFTIGLRLEEKIISPIKKRYIRSLIILVLFLCVIKVSQLTPDYLRKRSKRICIPSSLAWSPTGEILSATLYNLVPWLPLHLNGVSVHCWDCYNVRILSRGETVPTCENGEIIRQEKQQRREKRRIRSVPFTPTLLLLSVQKLLPGCMETFYCHHIN